MSFNVLAVQSGLDPGDGALYPKVSDAASPEIITLENQDGPNVMRAVATAVRVLESGETGLKTLVKLREVKIDVYVTDGRVALACEKYDKGGGWVGFGPGGLLVAVTANAVSKARAASRSRGKVLVGHLRYPWLKSVGASSKSGVVSSEAIRLEYAEKLSGRVVRKIVELTLPKNIDATLVAQEITRRAAAYRLANYSDMKAEERARFATMSAEPPRLQPPPKKFAFVQMPTFYYANAATAFPRPQQSAEPPEPAAGESAGSEDFDASSGTGIGSFGTGTSSPGTWTGGAGAGTGPAATGTGGARPFPADVPPAQRQPANFCTKCGHRLVLGDRFCPACGGRVDGAEGIPEAPSAGRTAGWQTT